MSTQVDIYQRRGTLGVGGFVNRCLEIFPGLITWSLLLLPIILSFWLPLAVAYFIIAFDLIWLVKSMRLSAFLVLGYSKLHRFQHQDWLGRLEDLENLETAIAKRQQEIEQFTTKNRSLLRFWAWGNKPEQRKQSLSEMKRYLGQLKSLDSAQVLKPSRLLNAVIISTYNESLTTLEPSVKAISAVNYPLGQMILVIAYEERGGDKTEANAKQLIKTYGSQFAHAMAIKHPSGIPGEGKVKGANMSWAAKHLTEYIQKQKIDPKDVIVTTFDSDHRPDPNYFAALTFEYAINPSRIRRSFQPIPMFYNNIWDAPAPMRLIATGNSFWMIMQTMRPHLLRNFAAHAQGLQALIDTDYWSKVSIVEDGHQYWRSYFRYHGDHAVVPIFVPVHQDAVLAKTYLKTFRAQYVQLRRWAWGVSDFPYVVRNCWKDSSIPALEKIQQIWRLFECHLSWATAPLILTFVAWLPLYVNHNFANQVLAHQLPILASRILSLAMIGMVVTAIISLISLPPRPPRYRRTRSLAMLVQWVLLPLTAIVFSAFAAIDAQTRLMFGRYLEWTVTEKATKE